MTDFKEKLEVIRKYSDSISHEVTETYQLLLDLYSYSPYLSSEMLEVLESELETAYQDILIEEEENKDDCITRWNIRYN